MRGDERDPWRGLGLLFHRIREVVREALRGFLTSAEERNERREISSSWGGCVLMLKDRER